MFEIDGKNVMPKLGLKILALFLGIMAWYLIQDAIKIEDAKRMGSFEPRRRVESGGSGLIVENDIPVTVLSRPGLWEWRIDPPVISTIWLEGSEADLKELKREMVRVFVDGSVITRPGEYAMPVKVYLPSHLGVKAVTDPDQVRLTVKPAVKGAQ